MSFERNPFARAPQEQAPITDPIRETPDAVSYLGVTLEKAEKPESSLVPRRENYADFINDRFALELQRKIAIAFLAGEPILIEGGTSIGKTTTVRKMAAELGYEVHYANLNGATDVEDLMGRYIPNPHRSKLSDPEYIFADGKVTSGLRQEHGAKKIIILDEFNAAAPNILIRLHEILDALERDGDVVLSEDASESVGVSHANTMVVALMNPPGKGFMGREPLDPTQLRRWVYQKEVTNLPAKTFSMSADALFGLGSTSETVPAATILLSRDVALPPDQLKDVPGITDILAKYKEFHHAAKELLKERAIAADQPQPFSFDDRMEPRRVRDFVLRFYAGDINATFQEALRYFYSNKLESAEDRAKLEELIAHVAYVPKLTSKRKGLETPATAEKKKRRRSSESWAEAVREREAKRLRNFFGYDIEIPPLPLGITLEHIEKWERNLFELRYLPEENLTEDRKLPGWEHKPGKKYAKGNGIDFYGDLKKIQDLPENTKNPKLEGFALTQLTGQWVLFDTRDKPNDKVGIQEYKDDTEIRKVLQRLAKDGVVNKEAGDGLRNKIDPKTFDDSRFWDAMAAALGVEDIPGTVVRLPRTIEANFMGQGPGFHGTSTYEWNEEYYQSGSRLICGYSDYGGASGVYWNDRPYGRIGFRPLVVFSSDIGALESLEFGTLERLREEESRKLTSFFEKTIDVPPLPDGVTPERVQAWAEQGLELHYLPAEDMQKDRKLKGWSKKPENRFYDQIANGELPKDAAKLQSGWVLVDARPKPNYDNGDQMYADDPFAKALTELNRTGVIEQKNYDGIKKLAPGSRFGLHPNDFDNPKLVEAIAKTLDLEDAEDLSLPRLIEWNLIANIHHPEWGETNTAEWVQEKLKSGGRLICGYSVNGGASSVDWHDRPFDSIGFRPLGRFSS